MSALETLSHMSAAKCLLVLISLFGGIAEETTDAVAIFPSLESQLGEDTEEPWGSEVAARKALTEGDSLDLSPCCGVLRSRHVVPVAHGDMPPSTVQPQCECPTCCRFLPSGMWEERWRFWQQPSEQLGFLATSGCFWLLKMVRMFERHLDVLEGMSLHLSSPLFSCMKAMVPQALFCLVGELRGSIKGSHHPLSRF